MSKIKLCKIVKDSTTDGPGVRFAIHTQTCFFKCEGCSVPHTWDAEQGQLFDIEDIISDIKEVADKIDGITFSGGEPFLQADPLTDILIELNKAGITLPVLCYTGYTWEELILLAKESNSYNRLLMHIDQLIDGRYDKDKATMDLKYRGSVNQRYIDVRESMKSGTIVKVKEDDNNNVEQEDSK